LVFLNLGLDTVTISIPDEGEILFGNIDTKKQLQPLSAVILSLLVQPENAVPLQKSEKVKK